MTITDEQLINQLKDPDERKRYGALLELLNFNLPLFDGPDGDLKRSMALEELRQHRMLLAMEPLLQILINDPSESNRSRAADILGDYGDSRAIAPLRKWLDDEDPKILGIAIQSLGRLKDEDSIPRFLAFLDKSHDKWIRITAIHALCELYYFDARSYFQHLLHDPDEIVRMETMLGLLALSEDKREIKADLMAFLSDSYEPNRHLAQQSLKLIEMDEKGES